MYAETVSPANPEREFHGRGGVEPWARATNGVYPRRGLVSMLRYRSVYA